MKHHRAIITTVIILAATGLFLWHKQQTSPDHIFKDSFAVAFSTKSVEQTQKVVTSTSEAPENTTIKYDFSQTTNAKVSVDFNSSGSVTQQYGDATGSFIKYLKIDSGFTPSFSQQLQAYVGKWIQTRKGNTFVNTTYDAPFTPDPQAALLGDYIFGDFSKDQRNTLLKYINAHQIYTYDAKKVARSTMNGESVYVYPVTENLKNVDGLNKLAAKMFGIPSDNEAEYTSGQLIRPAQNFPSTLYISTKSKQVLRDELTIYGVKVLNDYADYNSTTVPARPMPAL